MVRGGEDFDLAMRILQAGFEMWFVPDAIIRHKVSANRLRPEFMRWDAYLGGVLQASLDVKYRSATTALVLCGARVGKSLAILLPKLIFSKVTGRSAASVPVEMSLRRQMGYVRGLLMAFFPRVFPEDALNEQRSFRKRREVEASHRDSMVR
jgi:hypothetical protein